MLPSRAVPLNKLSLYFCNYEIGIMSIQIELNKCCINACCTQTLGYTLGCPNNHSSQGFHVPLKHVIMYGIIMHYLNFQSFPSPFNIRKFHLIYTKEILKNTREKASWISFLFFRPKNKCICNSS